MIKFRDKISSEEFNRLFSPFDAQIDTLLDVKEIDQLALNSLKFASSYLNESYSSITATLATEAFVLGYNHGVLLPLFLPTNKYGKIVPGAFTVDFDEIPAVSVVRHGSLYIAPYSVHISDDDGHTYELTDTERILFAGLFTGSNWFLKQLDTESDAVNVRVEFSPSYPYELIKIFTIPQLQSNIELLSPTPDALTTASGYFFISDDSGVIEFRVPLVNNESRKYLILNQVGVFHIIRKPYAEYVMQISAASPLNLVGLNVVHNFCNLRVLITNTADFVVDMDDLSGVEVSYDSARDQFPLILGSHALSETNYLHLIVYASDRMPLVKKVILKYG